MVTSDRLHREGVGGFLLDPYTTQLNKRFTLEISNHDRLRTLHKSGLKKRVLTAEHERNINAVRWYLII